MTSPPKQKSKTSVISKKDASGYIFSSKQQLTFNWCVPMIIRSIGESPVKNFANVEHKLTLTFY